MAIAVVSGTVSLYILFTQPTDNKTLFIISVVSLLVGILADRRAGKLEDRNARAACRDRIFTNLYGFQPWNLAAARKRGDWEDTKSLLALWPRCNRRCHQGSRACAVAAAPASRPA